MLDSKCNKCGLSLRRLMLLALIQDAGATVSQSANSCSAGGEHDFKDKQEAEDNHESNS